MAVPKKRLTNRRRNNRRKSPGHQQAKFIQLAKCSNCASRVWPHSVCPDCGFYKGRKVLAKLI
jgi:large subunit ribosomal protein L32